MSASPSYETSEICEVTYNTENKEKNKENTVNAADADAADAVESVPENNTVTESVVDPKVTQPEDSNVFEPLSPPPYYSPPVDTGIDVPYPRIIQADNEYDDDEDYEELRGTEYTELLFWLYNDTKTMPVNYGDVYDQVHKILNGQVCCGIPDHESISDIIMDFFQLETFSRVNSSIHMNSHCWPFSFVTSKFNSQTIECAAALILEIYRMRDPANYFFKVDNYVNSVACFAYQSPKYGYLLNATPLHSALALFCHDDSMGGRGGEVSQEVADVGASEGAPGASIVQRELPHELKRKMKRSRMNRHPRDATAAVDGSIVCGDTDERKEFINYKIKEVDRKYSAYLNEWSELMSLRRELKM